MTDEEYEELEIDYMVFEQEIKTLARAKRLVYRKLCLPCPLCSNWHYPLCKEEVCIKK